MTNQPSLNPDALALGALSVECQCSDHLIECGEYYIDCPRHAHYEKAVSAYLTVAQPVVNTFDIDEVALMWRQASEAIDHEHLDPREFLDLAKLKWLLDRVLTVAQPVVNSFDPRELNRKGWTCGCEPGDYDECDDCQSACNELADFLNRPEVKP